MNSAIAGFNSAFIIIHMTILQFSFLIFPLTALYILLVPINIILRMDSFFLREVRIRFFPFNVNIGKKKKVKKEKKKDKIDVAKFIANEFNTIRQSFTPLCEFVISLFVSKHHYLNISMQGGFGAPDVTGIVLGTIEAVRPACGNRVTIVYRPDFMAQSINGTICAETVVRVYTILANGMILLIRLPVIDILKVLKKISKGEYYARKT